MVATLVTTALNTNSRQLFFLVILQTNATDHLLFLFLAQFGIICHQVFIHLTPGLSKLHHLRLVDTKTIQFLLLKYFKRAQLVQYSLLIISYLYAVNTEIFLTNLTMEKPHIRVDKLITPITLRIEIWIVAVWILHHEYLLMILAASTGKLFIFIVIGLWLEVNTYSVYSCLVTILIW